MLEKIWIVGDCYAESRFAGMVNSQLLVDYADATERDDDEAVERVCKKLEEINKSLSTCVKFSISTLDDIASLRYAIYEGNPVAIGEGDYVCGIAGSEKQARVMYRSLLDEGEENF